MPAQSTASCHSACLVAWRQPANWRCGRFNCNLSQQIMQIFLCFYVKAECSSALWNFATALTWNRRNVCQIWFILHIHLKRRRCPFNNKIHNWMKLLSLKFKWANPIFWAPVGKIFVRGTTFGALKFSVVSCDGPQCFTKLSPCQSIIVI